MYRTLTLCSLLVAACAVESSTDPSIGDGHSDSIAGKGLKIRPTDSDLFIWNPSAVDQWLMPAVRQGKTTILLTTNDEVVAEGQLLLAWGTTENNFADHDPSHTEWSPWSGDRIARFSVANVMGDARITFLIFNGDGSMLSCKNARGQASTFSNVAIDLQSKRVHADDSITFTFAECGLTKSDPDGVWRFAMFPVAFDSNLPLVGTHSYELTATML